jgi:hypothetical protein
MLSATIHALEERDVVILDIPGALMQADIDEVVHVKFEGEIAEMLVKLDPRCTKNLSGTSMANHCISVVRRTAEGTLWHTEGCTLVLETTVKQAGIMGFCN